jgi:hypothetical protein
MSGDQKDHGEHINKNPSVLSHKKANIIYGL